MVDFRRVIWEARFLRLAREVSTWSKDPSTKTGSIISTHDHRVLAIGYNGFPRGMADDDEILANRDAKLSRTIHCEMNAILSSSVDLSGRGATLYVWPFLTCDRCAVHVIQAGIRRVVTVRATDQQLERWGESFEKARSYYEECGVRVTEHCSSIVTR